MDNMVRIYTDGACSGNPGPGGFCALIVTKDGYESFSGNDLCTTNNRMEMEAVVHGLISARKVSLRKDNVECIKVISDSAYVVNAFNNGWLRQWERSNYKTSSGDDVKNVDLWVMLQRQISYYTNRGIAVLFEKVKGHAGNPFNEECDKIARGESLKAKKKLESRNRNGFLCN